MDATGEWFREAGNLIRHAVRDMVKAYISQASRHAKKLRETAWLQERFSAVRAKARVTPSAFRAFTAGRIRGDRHSHVDPEPRVPRFDYVASDLVTEDAPRLDKRVTTLVRLHVGPAHPARPHPHQHLAVGNDRALSLFDDNAPRLHVTRDFQEATRA